jgi:hypothetical protein
MNLRRGRIYANKNIVYVGIDIDNTAFLGAGFVVSTGERCQFLSKLNSGALIKR